MYETYSEKYKNLISQLNLSIFLINLPIKLMILSKKYALFFVYHTKKSAKRKITAVEMI